MYRIHVRLDKSRLNKVRHIQSRENSKRFSSDRIISFSTCKYQHKCTFPPKEAPRRCVLPRMNDKGHYAEATIKLYAFK